MTRRCATFLIAVAATGCSYLPPVEFDASAADVEVLAGEWFGEYSSASLGRRGTIEFRLKAATGEAAGDVRMIPAAGEQSTGAPAEFLTVHFVRVADGTVSGTLDRYWDPDRRSFAWTRLSAGCGQTRSRGHSRRHSKPDWHRPAVCGR